MVKPHTSTSDTRMTYEYIRVTYGWYTSTYEWHTDAIRVHTSDTRITYEYVRVTYEWHTSTCEWHTEDIRVTYEHIRVHKSDIRMTYRYMRVTYRWHAVRKKNKVNFFDNPLSKRQICKRIPWDIYKIKKGSGISFRCTFSACFFQTNAPYLMLYLILIQSFNIFFPSQDIK